MQRRKHPLDGSELEWAGQGHAAVGAGGEFILAKHFLYFFFSHLPHNNKHIAVYMTELRVRARARPDQPRKIGNVSCESSAPCLARCEGACAVSACVIGEWVGG